MEVAGGLKESGLLTSLPEDCPSPSQGLGQHPRAPLECPALVWWGQLCWQTLGLLGHGTSFTGIRHWDCWGIVLALLGHSSGFKDST